MQHQSLLESMLLWARGACQRCQSDVAERRCHGCQRLVCLERCWPGDHIRRCWDCVPTTSTRSAPPRQPVVETVLSGPATTQCRPSALCSFADRRAQSTPRRTPLDGVLEGPAPERSRSTSLPGRSAQQVHSLHTSADAQSRYAPLTRAMQTPSLGMVPQSPRPVRVHQTPRFGDDLRG